jgi:dUTP pyrophosphatase
MERLEVLIANKAGPSLPGYATQASAGLDLVAFIGDPIRIQPLSRALVPTGIFVAIPEGFEAEIRPRSGLANQFGVTVLNTPGTIDADYRGEVKVLLINLGQDPFIVRNGDRIAQMIFKSVVTVDWIPVDTLPESTRGQGGFGSTGIK